ncbi:hypothetical protein DB827_17480, partial [Xanthomonas perforans]
DARMQWRQPVGVDGRVRIQVRDLAFLVALYARDRSIPNWMLRLVDAGQAQLTARAHWQGETVIVDRLQARNERFQVDARLRLQGNQRRGSLLARWGLLSAAVGLRGDTPEWHLRGAPEWYRAQPDLLR